MELLHRHNSLLHGITRNDMVINTYEIQQIQVIFYWVSEYKPHCYQYVIIASYAHLRYRLADDDGMPNLLVTIIA